MSLRVVEEERQTFPVTLRSIRLDFLQLCASTPDLSHRHCAVDLHGFLGCGERIRNARDLRAPRAEVEIEIVLRWITRRSLVVAPVDLCIVADPFVLVHPVHFPRLAAVI